MKKSSNQSKYPDRCSVFIAIRTRSDESFGEFDLRFRPKATNGLVRVTASGLWCKPSDLARYRQAVRNAAITRNEWMHEAPEIVFEVALIDSNDDEATALVALGLNYHDDRGDGLLHVPAFRSAKHLCAWRLAAERRGIVSKVTDASRI